MEKKSKTKPTGRPSNSITRRGSNRSSKPKINVFKPFDPISKTKRTSNTEDLPDIIINEINNEEKLTPKRINQKNKKRPSQSIPTEAAIRKSLTLRRESKNGSQLVKRPSQTSLQKSFSGQKKDNNGPPVVIKSERCESACGSPKVPASNNKITVPPVPANLGHTASQIQTRIQRNIENINNRGSLRMSMKDVRCRLQEKLCVRPVCAPQSQDCYVRDLKQEILSAPPSAMPSCSVRPCSVTPRSVPPCSVSPCSVSPRSRPPCAVPPSKPITKRPSASSCGSDFCKTVSDLKMEIEQYRESLSKNVNILQGKLGPNFFEKSPSQTMPAQIRNVSINHEVNMESSNATSTEETDDTEKHPSHHAGRPMYESEPSTDQTGSSSDTDDCRDHVRVFRSDRQKVRPIDGEHHRKEKKHNHTNTNWDTDVKSTSVMTDSTSQSQCDKYCTAKCVGGRLSYDNSGTNYAKKSSLDEFLLEKPNSNYVSRQRRQKEIDYDNLLLLKGILAAKSFGYSRR